MSDLVEKVAKAIKVAQGRAHPASDFGYVHAHYAITAVADWLDTQEDGDLDFIKFQLRRAVNEQ